ncbi:hypothetical protein TeGR_g6022, partial [Tetraparma gracilis]
MAKKHSKKHQAYKAKQSGSKGTAAWHDAQKKNRKADGNDSDASFDSFEGVSKPRPAAAPAKPLAPAPPPPLPPPCRVVRASSAAGPLYALSALPQEAKLLLKGLCVQVSGELDGDRMMLPLEAGVKDLLPLACVAAPAPPAAEPALASRVPAGFHALLSSLPATFSIPSLNPIQRTFYSLFLSAPLPLATVVSATGSGKTLTYLLPILDLIRADRDFLAVVVAPTRELASQIRSVFKKLGREASVRTGKTNSKVSREGPGASVG